MEGLSEIQIRAKDLVEQFCVKMDVGVLQESLSAEVKDKATCSILARNISDFERQAGAIVAVGEPTETTTENDITTVSMPIQTEKRKDLTPAQQEGWYADIDLDNDGKVVRLGFSRKPVYSPPESYALNKVIDVSIDGLRFTKPALRRTPKIPVAVFVHSIIEVDIDGHLGQRFPFRDLSFMAQEGIGFVRAPIQQEIDFVTFYRDLIHKALNLPETEKVFLIVHGHAALFLPEIIEGITLDGIVLLNPVWEAHPDLGIPPMQNDRVPQNIPVLIIGSGYDQFFTPLQFESWRSAIPTSEYTMFPDVDHFLMTCRQPPVENEYAATPGHVKSDVIRSISKWILEQQTNPRVD